MDASVLRINVPSTPYHKFPMCLATRQSVCRPIATLGCLLDGKGHHFFRKKSIHALVAAATASGVANDGAAGTEAPNAANQLTPRQRRLAQQRRKWKEEQQQQRPQKRKQAKAASAPLSTQPEAAASSRHPDHGRRDPNKEVRQSQQQPQQAHQQKQQQPVQDHEVGIPLRRTTADEAPSSQAAARAAPLPVLAPSSACPPPKRTSAAAACSALPNSQPAHTLAAPPHTLTGTSATAPGREPAEVAAGPGSGLSPAPSKATRASHRLLAASGVSDGSKRGQGKAPLPSQAAAAVPQAQGSADWPSLFADAGEGAGAGTVHSAAPSLPLSLDLDALPGARLEALALRWAQELTDFWDATGDRGPGQEEDSQLAGGHGPALPLWSSSAAALSPRSASPQGGAATSALQRQEQDHQQQQQQQQGWPGRRALPEVVGSRLAQLTAAVEARMTHGSLGHQELADLAWAVAHYDRECYLRVLQPAMGVPFSVVPRFMPDLRLEDFMSEVELRRDVIYLDGGARAVEESRRTGWQSHIGATFKYSGKEMLPQPGGLSPQVAKVRDALQVLTGVQYDSVLINFYEDGKCGMRYHVDPLYDRWTPNSAVVSLGATRSFIFREISDFNTRWQYRVRNGDAVLMYGDCQERLQHCIRVEKRAEDAGPRMSLVFKERLRGADGEYLMT